MSVPRRLSTRVLAQTPWLSLLAHDVEDRPGSSREVNTLKFPDWVVATARTTEGRWVLVRQFRHGIEGMTIEPAGGIIDDGEAPQEAAVRELMEETGYGGGRITPLGAAHPNAALSANRVHYFFIDEVQKLAEPEQAPDELTEVLLLSDEEVELGLDSGTFSHALGMLALMRARGVVSRRGHLATLLKLEEHQLGRVRALAQRLRPDLTAEDLQSPHDFPELDDPDWHFEDGQLAGIKAARIALARSLDVFDGSPSAH
jgi:ADP-ribose pyrophosphatase